MKSQTYWSRTVSIWAACLTVLMMIATAVWAPPARAEKWQSTPTGWWWLHNASEDAINAKASQGFRVIDIEVEQASPLRFAAAYVANNGVHAKGWWWYFGTEAYINGKANEHNARIIDIEGFEDQGQLRFAAVMVAKNGEDNKAWWWYYGNFDFITGKVDQHNARLIDLDVFTFNGQTLFAAAMIANTGADSKVWWYYSNITGEEVSQKLTEHKARLIDIERRSPTTFTVVMEKSDGTAWWWYYDASEAGVNFLKEQNGARIFDVETYEKDGQKRFAVLMIDNSNALTQKIRYDLDTALGDVKAYGFYLKRVNGPVLAQLQPDYAYYAASSIKVVHHKHAMRWATLPPGSPDPFAKLNTQMTIFTDSCTNSGSQTQEALSQSLSSMMQQSNNDRTNAVQDYFTPAALNATAHDVVGMSAATQINSKFGNPCGGPGADPPNRTTLRDIALIYERVAKGELLQEPYLQRFHDLMLNETNADAIPALIDEEAGKLNLSAAQTQAFKDNVQMMYKNGSWKSGATYWETRAGWISLPVKSNGQIVPRGYVYSLFAEEVEGIDPGEIVSDASIELLRGEVRSALMTWSQTIGTLQPDQQSELSSADGKVKLLFPTGAVSTTVDILHTPLRSPNQPLPAGMTGMYYYELGAISNVGNPVEKFAKPYTMQVSYAGIDLAAAGPSEQQLRIAYWNGDEWEMVPGSVDTANRRVEATLDHFSEFALVGVDTQPVYLPMVVR